MTDVSRRTFLATTAVGLGAGLTGPGAPSAIAAEDDFTDLVDAHVHVWTPDTAAWPLAPEFTKADMQPASFTAEELLASCRPLGVSRVVLIQMSFYGFDNSYMLACIHRHAPAFAGVGIVDHDKPGVADEMKALKERGVRGFRLYANRNNAEGWAGSAGMKAMWECGAEENLAICLLADPDALPAIAAQVERFPKTPVVIDHFARLGMKGGLDSPEAKADLDRLLRLADHPQVHVKVSAFYALGAKSPPYDDLAPMIRRLRDAYGAKRLMWATDCPYQLGKGPAGEAHSYEASLALVRDRLDFLSREERLDILRNTARRVFFDGEA
jgi:predicted TIM-barrel fold metal-dependent hydrolase